MVFKVCWLLEERREGSFLLSAAARQHGCQCETCFDMLRSRHVKTKVRLAADLIRQNDQPAISDAEIMQMSIPVFAASQPQSDQATGGPQGVSIGFNFFFWNHQTELLPLGSMMSYPGRSAYTALLKQGGVQPGIALRMVGCWHNLAQTPSDLQ